MDKVFSNVRQVHGRSPTDDLNDFDENNATWSTIMNVSFQAAVHHGRDYMENPQFTKNKLLKSVKQTEKLTLVRQKSVVWPRLWEIDDSTIWQCDGSFEYQNLCLRRLGALSGRYKRKPERLLEEQIKWDNWWRANGLREEKHSQCSLHWTFSKFQKSLNWISVWTCAVQRKDYLHVNVQRYCMVRTRKHIEM